MIHRDIGSLVFSTISAFGATYLRGFTLHRLEYLSRGNHAQRAEAKAVVRAMSDLHPGMSVHWPGYQPRNREARRRARRAS